MPQKVIEVVHIDLLGIGIDVGLRTLALGLTRMEGVPTMTWQPPLPAERPAPRKMA